MTELAEARGRLRHTMAFILILLSYIAGAGLLVGGMIGAAIVFLQPLPGPSQKAQAAPIPPKMAEGIARRNESWPTEEKKPVAAPVTATVTPKAVLRDLSPQPAREPRRKAQRSRQDDRSVSASRRNEVAPPPARSENWGYVSRDERHGD